MLDEKGRLFGKISIVDLFIIIVVILAVAMLAFRFTDSKTAKFGSSGQSECTYTITVKNVRDETVTAIKQGIGYDVYDMQNGNIGPNIGTMQRVVEVKPCEGVIYKDDGTAVKAEMPGRYEVTFEVKSRASKSSQSVLLGGKKEVSNGSYITVSTMYSLNEGRVADITFKSE